MLRFNAAMHCIYVESDYYGGDQNAAWYVIAFDSTDLLKCASFFSRLTRVLAGCESIFIAARTIGSRCGAKCARS
jgi:hypothetical protein